MNKPYSFRGHFSNTEISLESPWSFSITIECELDIGDFNILTIGDLDLKIKIRNDSITLVVVYEGDVVKSIVINDNPNSKFITNLLLICSSVIDLFVDGIKHSTTINAFDFENLFIFSNNLIYEGFPGYALQLALYSEVLYGEERNRVMGIKTIAPYINNNTVCAFSVFYVKQQWRSINSEVVLQGDSLNIFNYNYPKIDSVWSDSEVIKFLIRKDGNQGVVIPVSDSINKGHYRESVLNVFTSGLAEQVQLSQQGEEFDFSVEMPSSGFGCEIVNNLRTGILRKHVVEVYESELLLFSFNLLDEFYAEGIVYEEVESESLGVLEFENRVEKFLIYIEEVLDFEGFPIVIGSYIDVQDFREDDSITCQIQADGEWSQNVLEKIDGEYTGYARRYLLTGLVGLHEYSYNLMDEFSINGNSYDSLDEDEFSSNNLTSRVADFKEYILSEYPDVDFDLVDWNGWRIKVDIGVISEEEENVIDEEEQSVLFEK